MLYNDTTIQLLTDLIGWAGAVPPSDIAVSSQNGTATSGRKYVSFHQAAIVENVDASLPNAEKDSTTLNALLYRMKQEAVLEVLGRIFDSNPLAYSASQEINGKVYMSINYAVQYDNLITSRISVFSDPIGYCMARKCLQLFVTSTRSNRLQLIQDMNYEQLKMELDGIYGESGKMIAKGAEFRYQDAVKRAIEILFPTTVTSNNYLIGRYPW